MNLKQIRKLSGLKQNKVAKDLEINSVTYNGYETGKSEPSIEVIIKLANYFNVTTDELLGFKTKTQNLTERKKLQDKLYKLTESECGELNNYADSLILSRVEREKMIQQIIDEE